RENFGERMQQIADALAELAKRQDVAIVYPVHPNPNVTETMHTALGSIENIALLEPLDYVNFVGMMELSEIVLTDSGGIQEEAPSLGKPVLVMRDTTERPEGIEAGTAMLVGADRERILASVVRLLDDREAYKEMARAHNPYGDGEASKRIAAAVTAHHLNP
ncbi:MAG: UDP-N-acetylglucosamine 2-epimerase (non-hydrolyzing), partial [Pseudomonadota bacterium]